MTKIAKDFMIQNPVCIENTASIYSLNRLINVEGYSHIPVLEEGNLVGIVSKTDLMSRFLMMLEHSGVNNKSHHILNELKVKEIMTPNPIVVKEEDTVDHLTDLLTSGEYHSLIVVNELGKVQGIVTSYILFSEVYKSSPLFN